MRSLFHVTVSSMSPSWVAPQLPAAAPSVPAAATWLGTSGPVCGLQSADGAACRCTFDMWVDPMG